MDSERVSRAGSVKLPHSHSTPAGVDGGARTPPATPKKGGKMLAVRVQMLDDSITMFQVQAKATGRLLFEQVCKQLHLLEADYFGLEYQEHGGTRYWLDLEKPLSRQVGLTLVDTLLRFCVKFYTPDPAQLEEEFTRYLYCLQVKRDLCQGLLQCNDNTAALMASYIVQAECGDYMIEDYPDHTYLSTYKFTPTQDHELERRIMENHKKHAGQSPAEADLNLLETSRRCELYGMKMHAAKDHEGVPLNLAVAHMGIVVFQNYTKINTFSWAKIRKISFKRKRFLVKLHPEGYTEGYYKDTVEFFFEGRNECKNFWKKCVENHGFFRCSMVKRVPRQKTRVLSRGSSFRYSGKTQKQIVEFVRENYVKRQTFQRSQSFRHSNSVHSSVANVGQSLSAHPLLPLGENAVAGTQASLSCGSMTLSSEHRRRTPSLSSSPTHLADVHPPGSPSPPLTSQSSVTSSPQHFYPARRERDAANQAASPPVMNGDLEPPPSPRATAPAASTPRHNGNVEVHNHIELSPVVQALATNQKAASESDLSRQKVSLEKDADQRRRKYLNDRAYFIAKELLMTERTYKKDLEVLILWFRDEVSKEEAEMPDEMLNLMFALVDPMYTAHCALLRETEQRLATWEGRYVAMKSDAHKIADVLLKHLVVLPLYEDYLAHHLSLLDQLNAEFHRNRKFEQLYRDFELQKVCYLPLTSFVLKPLQRLLHYQHLLDRLASYYDKDHTDYEDCLLACSRLEETASQVPSALRQSENFVQLCELQRDMSGFDTLVQPGREFMRQGCLLKQSRKGYQQRMFFLFSDVLLYTNRAAGPSLQFRVHGQMPLRGVMVEEGDGKIGDANYSFTIYGGNRAITVAANSQAEKDKWLADLGRAMTEARDRGDNKLQYLSLKSCSSSDEVMDRCGVEALPTSQEKARQTQRSNTAVHVCWHRNTSLGIDDQLRATQNQLSGYLLRKFKNSNGWQKLWVVFTNFCLFFYKTFQDDFPLASLPLLSYTVGPPAEQDAIHKDFVFKLQFKNHLYFFRAESEYTFSRWMEVISSATQQTQRVNSASKLIDWDAPY